MKMKNLTQILMTILVLASIISCKKDDNKTSDTLKSETISGKWNVSGTSVFESFEFNKSGNYIIVKNTTIKSTNSKVVLFGTYTITDSKTLVLSDFGKITVSEVADKSISFSVFLTTDPSNGISIIAAKQDEMANSTRTDLLCRTWEMVSYNGTPVAGTEMELSVLFSAAGTYFVSFANPTDENDGGLAQWTWKDGTEKFMCYSWEGAPTCDGTNEVEIPELTATKLTIDEEGEVYILKPASNPKSGVIYTSGTSANTNFKKGFFKR